MRTEMKSLLLSVICLECIGSIKSAPTDGPVRIDLPVYGDVPEFLTRVPDGSFKRIEYDTVGLTPTAINAKSHPTNNIGAESGAIVGRILGHKLQTGSSILQKANIVSAQQNAQTGLFAQRPIRLESALLESEGIPSKTLSLKENLQKIVAGIFQPTPVVDDIISEDEKFGNSGQKFTAVGNFVVGGAEGFSNIVNSALELPFIAVRQITMTASEKLNNLGGKLVGL